MKEQGMNSRLYAVLTAAGLLLLFFLLLCYAFLSLGLLTLGLIALPCALLGSAGVLTVVTDLARTELFMISSGILLLGTGMCLGGGCVFPAAFGLYTRTCRVLRIKREREQRAAETGPEAGEP